MTIQYKIKNALKIQNGIKRNIYWSLDILIIHTDVQDKLTFFRVGPVSEVRCRTAVAVIPGQPDTSTLIKEHS